MQKRKKILVVDDEDRNRRLLEAMLISQGYEVCFAENGKKALQEVEAMAPDLILLDVMMPIINGFEVARRLKEREKTRIIPIVMVTALTDVESRVKALDVGADDFLSKPVDATELRARVQSCIKIKAYNDHMRNYQQDLESEVDKKTKQLQKAFNRIKIASLDTVNRLSKAAEYKDEDTGVHILRMSNYAATVARRMGLKQNTVESILYAAPMHDIGKIGTPDRILLKPGKLDPDEWKIMQQHTTNGGRILEGSVDFIKLGEVIALTHHERWDGSGYPTGIAGRKIPLVGRIVAIADVFDALTTKRPYKEPFSLEKSYGIIRESRGSHFDPDVVDAFFSVEEEILTIKEKYQDDNVSILYRLAEKPAE